MGQPDPLAAEPEAIPFELHRFTIEAMSATHRIEMAKKAMQVALYREALEEAGIDPPDQDGDDLLELVRNCNAVISTASEFVHYLGTSKEMLDGHKFGQFPEDRWSRPFLRWRMDSRGESQAPPPDLLRRRMLESQPQRFERPA